VTCRLCGGRTSPVGARPELALVRCQVCDFVSGIPVETRSAEHVYADYYHGAVLTAPAPEARYDEWLECAERQLPKGRLLEIGAGSGGFVQVALRRGWSVDATEISSSGLQQLAATGARVFAGDLQEAHYPDAAFDLVVSLEVLEHLPAPAAHMGEIARVLRPGGLLLLTTPNFNGLSRRLLGLRWRVIDPEHLGYFTPRTLTRALRSAGLREPRVRARTLDITTWRRAPQGGTVRFDPQRAAALRDGINASGALRRAKEGLNVVLGALGCGDSLLAWAQR
jgi:2-polyprenyl-3-methyl-5-hydroxy-6-metoxy-1,4-benzoquinol methylase